MQLALTAVRAAPHAGAQATHADAAGRAGACSAPDTSCRRRVAARDRAPPGVGDQGDRAARGTGEQARLASADERAAAARSFLDACCGGVGGLVEDYLTYASGWGFEPSEIETDVQLWHGGADPLVPVEHALQLAADLPRCHVFVDPDEGHHFFRARLAMILEALIAAPAQTPARHAAV